MSLLTDIPIDWENLILDDLWKKLVEAYSEPREAKHIVGSTGIAPGSYPIGRADMRQTWKASMNVLVRQGKLRALVENARADVTVKAYHTYFEKVLLLDDQDELNKKDEQYEIAQHSSPGTRTIDKAAHGSPYYSCFISYSGEDEAFAEKLHNDLLAAGVECWFAPEDLRIGAKKRVALGSAVLAHHKLLLILSKDSIANDWVAQQVETAIEKELDSGEIVLFPVRLDDSVFDFTVGWAAHIKRTRNIGDFREWEDADSYQKSLRRVLRDLTIEPGENNG